MLYFDVDFELVFFHPTLRCQGLDGGLQGPLFINQKNWHKPWILEIMIVTSVVSIFNI